MSRLGIEVFRQFFDKLSPHHEKVSALLVHFPLFNSGPSEPEPEERLAEYLRQRTRRREMGMPEPEIPEVNLYERTAFSRDADNDSSDIGNSGDRGDSADEHCQENERKHRGEECCTGRDDSRRFQKRSWRELYRR